MTWRRAMRFEDCPQEGPFLMAWQEHGEWKYALATYYEENAVPLIIDHNNSEDLTPVWPVWVLEFKEPF